jgi:hypothetical protein
MQADVARGSPPMLNSSTMAAKKTSKKPNKSSFIRSQPATMSTTDVIAAGKAAGLSFTSSLVYMVRGRQDGKATPRKATAKKSVAAKKASTKTAMPKRTSPASKPAPSKPTSKADFVRERAHLSPKEIVADAKAAGLKLDPPYVYKVRGYDKATASKRARTSKKSASKPAAVVTPTKTPASTSKTTGSNARQRSSDTTVEDLLRAAAAELGLGRAIEILQGERARVRAVIGG